MRLSNEQRRHYDENGYLFFESLFTPREVELLRERAFADSMASRDSAKMESGAQSTVRMLRGIHNDDPLFARLVQHPRLAMPAIDVIGDSVYVYQTRVVMKSGAQGRAFTMYPWHQDFSTWKTLDDMAEPRAVVIGIFLDEINACNAPLMVVPRSHHGGMIQRSEIAPDPMGTGQIVVDPPTMQSLVAQGGIRALMGPPGSTFFMHANLVHASNENITPLRRAILYVIYNAVSNHCASKRAEYFAPSECKPIEPLADDCLFESQAVET